MVVKDAFSLGPLRNPSLRELWDCLSQILLLHSGVHLGSVCQLTLLVVDCPWYGLDFAPPTIHMLRASPPVPQDVTLLQIWALQIESCKLRRGQTGVWWVGC